MEVNPKPQPAAKTTEDLNCQIIKPPSDVLSTLLAPGADTKAATNTQTTAAQSATETLNNGRSILSSEYRTLMLLARENNLAFTDILRCLNHATIEDGYITAISFEGHKLSSFGFLSHLSRLRALKMTGCEIKDSEPFPHLPHLLKLEIEGSSFSNLAWLQKTPALKRLYLYECQIQQFPERPLLLALEDLTINSCKLKLAGWLKCFPNLRILNLAQNDLQDNLDLPSIPSLKKLNLSQNPIGKSEALENLRNVPNLDELWLTQCELKGKIELPEMPLLKHLKLGSNPIDDISALSRSLPSLTKLNMNDTKISGDPDFSQMPRLESLSVNFNNIVKMTSILNLPCLKELAISKAGLNDVGKAQLNVLRNKPGRPCKVN